MRPLTAALACSLGGEFELSGVARMHERPIGDLVDALRAARLRASTTSAAEAIRRCASRRRAGLQLDAPIRVRGDVSSQFLTALLLALPLVGRAATIVDRSRRRADLQALRRDHAEPARALRHRGAARRLAALHDPAPAARYRSPGRIHVEADASSAATSSRSARSRRARSRVRIDGVGDDSIQGDIRFVDAARLDGRAVTAAPNWLEVRRGAWPLKAIDLDCNHIPDAAMTLAVMALYADGTDARCATSRAGA